MSEKGSKEAQFRVVYDEVFPVVLRVVYRVTGDQDVAEELCHDSFIKLYERIDTFPDIEQAKFWMIRVAKNHALNYVKRKQRERKAYERVLAQPERVMPSGEEIALREWDHRAIQKALQRLPENLRSVLVMKEYAELNYREISKALNISEANVKVRVFRARQRLAQAMKEIEEEAGHE